MREGGFVDLAQADTDWKDRYRLAAFASTNGFDYLPQAPTNLLPGRDKHKPRHAPFAIYEVLTTRQERRASARIGEHPSPEAHSLRVTTGSHL